MSILIDKVRIKNFRSLKDVEIDLQPITILVGANNAGKTTFLRALNAVLGASRVPLSKEDLFIGKNTNDPENKIITIDIRIVPINEEGKRINDFNDRWQQIFGEQAQTETNGFRFFAFRTTYDFSKGGNYESQSFFFEDWQVEPTTTKTDVAIIKSISLYFLDAQRDLQDDVKLRNSYFGKLATQLADDYKEEDLTKLKGMIEVLNNTAVEKSEVLRELKKALGELNKTTQTSGEGVSITPFPKQIRDLHKGMKVYFQDNGSDSFSMEYHGMGTRSWASILSFGAYINWTLEQIEKQIQKGKDTNLLFPILALEEPEAHLHPNAQRTLYQQLKEFQGQKIVSTHSPYIAGQAELEELRHFYKKSDESEISKVVLIFNKKLDAINQELTQIHHPTNPRKKELEKVIIDVKDKKRVFLRRYKNRLSNLRGEMLFSRCIIFCEGETEEQIISELGEKYFGQNLFDLGINIIGVDGFENYSPFISIVSSLNIAWYIFSDGEDDTIDSLIEDICLLPEKQHNLERVVCLPDKKNIEQYFYSLYPNEITIARANYETENWDKSKVQHIQSKKQEILNESADAMATFMKNNKTKFAPYFIKAILQCGDIKKIIPPLFLQLFDKIAEDLEIKSEHRNKWEFYFDILDIIKNKNNETTTL